MSKLQLSFFRSQLVASRRKPKGYRWTLTEKLFCVQLHCKSPVAYRFLSQRFALPSVSTLLKFVSAAVGRVDSGFSDIVMQLLRMRLTDLPFCDRQCALVFDEMSLKKQLTFDKHLDKIVGYTDDGKVATHALVFIIRGLHAKWKQPIGFFLTHNTVASSKLSDLIKDCVSHMYSVGLFVRCVVCDQGATNVSALKQLGFSVDAPHIMLHSLPHVVHVIFDVPHLLKNIRNNLQRHDIQHDDSVASWKYVDMFYRIDKDAPIRLAPKLTDRHVDVSGVGKMRVSLAAQVLSHSVAAGISMRTATRELPADALGTAALIENVDRLFDLLNSRLLKGERPARCAVTSKNSNLKEMLSLKAWLDKWVFVGARSQLGVNCHWGLQATIVSVGYIHYAVNCLMKVSDMSALLDLTKIVWKIFLPLCEASKGGMKIRHQHSFRSHSVVPC